MRRILFSVAIVLAACGDNSSECDPGSTMNVGGKCVGNATTCSDGTILVDDHCEIDPNSCQDGTVLVNGACVDPGHVAADIEEGAEPNGLGLFELSANPAGTIALKPAGSSFVIHGKIIPFQDDDGDGQQDADIDTYVVTVTAPTKLTLSADGLNGLAAGFVSVANVPSTDLLSNWVRFGINLNGDTSKRELYLPVAGTYLVGIGDSRGLLLTGGAAGAPMGKPAFEYYVSVEQTAATPTTLAVANGIATSTGTRNPGETKLFTVAMGLGINDAELDSTAPQVQDSILITRTRSGSTTLRDIADEDQVNTAFVSSLGFFTGDTSVIVADSRFDYANAPTPYDLVVTTRGGAPLSTTGGMATQPGSDIDFTTFFYDVPADGTLLGMNLHFDKEVSGVIIDENFFIRAAFTYNGGFANTFQDYVGLVKHPAPGRYYFLTVDPHFDPATPTSITATSTLTGITPGTVVKSTPLTNEAVGPFAANAYNYTTGVATDAWQTFTSSGTGTGNITISYFNPMTFSGRLDPLVTVTGSASADAAATPLFTTAHVAAGTTRPRILLDTPTNLASYLVKVDTATTTGAPTFNLTFAPQTNVTDFGTVAAGMNATANNKPIDTTTNAVQRFIVRTNAGNRLTLTSTPDAALNTTIQRVTVTEGATGTAGNNGAVGAVDTLLFQQPTTFTAFTVTGVGGTQGMFNMGVGALPPPYATATGTTPYADACNGGTAITLDDPDEGQSASIAAPANFDFFGSPVTNFKFFSNGFITFNTATACTSVGGNCFFTNADIPSTATPNNIIAPFWDDLVISSACQKTSGTKLILQWVGEDFFFGDPVQFQVILDGANDTIEFVYGSQQVSDGGATIGLENVDATLGVKLSFNTSNPSPKTLFTPQ